MKTRTIEDILGELDAFDFEEVEKALASWRKKRKKGTAGRPRIRDARVSIYEGIECWRRGSKFAAFARLARANQIPVTTISGQYYEARRQLLPLHQCLFLEGYYGEGRRAGFGELPPPTNPYDDEKSFADHIEDLYLRAARHLGPEATRLISDLPELKRLIRSRGAAILTELGLKIPKD